MPKKGSPAAAPKKGSATAANTPNNVYMDTFNKAKECAKDKQKIAKKCQPEDQEKKDKRKDTNSKKKGSLLSKIKSPGSSGKNPNPDAQWINDHCEFLMHKPGDAEGLWKELEGSIGEAAVNKVVEEAKQKLTTAVEKAVAKKVAEIAAKSAAKRVLSLFTGPFALVINVALAAADIYELTQAIPNIEKQFGDLKSQVDDALKKVQEAKDIRDKFLNSKGEFSKDALVADMMHGASVANPCTNARRCDLVNYKDTKTKKDAAKGKGCCPGQTGHHLLPSAMFEGCADYKEDEAPTICAEGANNSNGSHGMIHRNMRDILDGLKDKAGNDIRRGATITKDQAISSATTSVRETFPTAGCNPRCIKAQLKEYYDKLKCDPKSHPGVGEGDGGSVSTTPKPIG
jgi:GHH signature containing HNH/Endo VII superfamily nuclease toxin  2